MLSVRPLLFVSAVCLLGLAVGTFIDGSIGSAIVALVLLLVIVVTAIWGFNGIVIALMVASLLPLPTLTVRTATFGLATLAGPVILVLGLLINKRRGQQPAIPYVRLYLLLVFLGLISIWNSWLYWDPSVLTGSERGYGHRWIGYQLAGLGFLAIPYIAFAGGVIYGRLAPLRPLFVATLLTLAGLVALDLWSWLQHPVNPLVSYANQGYRPPIDFRAAASLVVMSAALVFWERTAKRLLGLIPLAMGMAGVLLAYFVSAWVAVLIALSIMVWRRWGSRGLVGWFLGSGAIALILRSSVSAVIQQRAASSDVDRLLLWKSALTVWSKSPLLGVGPGNLPSYMEAFSAFSIDRVLQGYQEAHSIYLELLAEIGVLGMTLFLAFFFMVLISMMRKPTGIDNVVCSASLGLLLTTSGLALFGGGFVPTVGSAGWGGVPQVVLAWFFAGCGVALSASRQAVRNRPHKQLGVRMGSPPGTVPPLRLPVTRLPHSE